LPFPEVARVSLADAKARSDAGTAVIVDVRSFEEYQTGHIPNAVSIPLFELTSRYQELPKNVELITYCA
jgi:rhodanese-related sulfurtransferase